MAFEWKDIAVKFADLAPALGAAIGGPAGGAAGLAISALAKVFGLKADETTPEAVAGILATDSPETRLKIITAENDFKLRQREMEIDELKVVLGDIQSARTRQVETEKATGHKDTNLYVLAWTIVVGFFLLLVFLLYVTVPADQNGVVFMLFGALATGFGQVLQYFFGSSKGSADKAATIAAAMEKK